MRAIGATVIIRKVPLAQRTASGLVYYAPPNPWTGKETREDMDAPRAVIVSIGPRVHHLGAEVGDTVRWNPRGEGKPHDWMPREDGYLTVDASCILAVEE